MDRLQTGRLRRGRLHMDRRQFALGAGAALGCLAFGPVRGGAMSGPSVSETPAEVVRTRLGVLHGKQMPGCVAFLGVPFAEPPVGPLRFLPPRAAKAWSGVRPALEYAAPPLQLKRTGTSEDCLYLNVWMPAAPGPHPVLVWLYGGGNQMGATGGVADGSHFARNGIVCVTPAYRVGVAGFLDVSSVLGDGYAGSGNNGLLDQLLALRWVSENIAAFGGDAERVTLGGESAGGKDTCALLGSAQSAGLYRQVIVESGGAQTMHNPESAAVVTQEFLAQARLVKGHADALLTMPAAQLLEAQAALLDTYEGDFPFRAVVDGHLLDRAPLTAVRGGSTRGLRMLAGSNRDESSYFVKGVDLERPIGPKEVSNLEFDRVAAMEARYRELFPQLTDAQRKVRLLSAEEYWIPTLRVLEAHVANGGEAYCYRFDVAQASGPLAGAVPHASELRFVWDDERPQDAATRIAVMTAMHAAWVEFIRGDVPSIEGAPAWTRFDLSQRPVMRIDQTSAMVFDPDGAERRLWDGWPA